MASGTQTGYVLATFGPEHPSNSRKAGVECDVVCDNRERTIIRNALVCVDSSSPPSEAPQWRPTATGKNLDLNQPLVLASPALYSVVIAALPDLSALDGEYVMMAFREGRTDQPYIIRSVPHPRTSPLAGAGIDVPWPSDNVPHPAPPTGHVRSVYHAGMRVGIDMAGNLFVDTTEAPTFPTGDPAPYAPAGAVALNLKAGTSVTLRFNGGPTVLKFTDLGAVGGLKVDIGSAPAHKVVFGDVLKGHLDAQATALKGHSHPSHGAVSPDLQATMVPFPEVGLSNDMKLTG